MPRAVQVSRLFEESGPRRHGSAFLATRPWVASRLAEQTRTSRRFQAAASISLSGSSLSIFLTVRGGRSGRRRIRVSRIVPSCLTPSAPAPRTCAVRYLRCQKAPAAGVAPAVALSRVHSWPRYLLSLGPRAQCLVPRLPHRCNGENKSTRVSVGGSRREQMSPTGWLQRQHPGGAGFDSRAWGVGRSVAQSA